MLLFDLLVKGWPSVRKSSFPRLFSHQFYLKICYKSLFQFGEQFPQALPEGVRDGRGRFGDCKVSFREKSCQGEFWNFKCKRHCKPFPGRGVTGLKEPWQPSQFERIPEIFQIGNSQAPLVSGKLSSLLLHDHLLLVGTFPNKVVNALIHFGL